MFRVLESLLDDETFYASSNIIDSSLMKFINASSSLSSLQFGYKLLIRIIERFGLWNSHLNMLTVLMYQREFQKIAPECVLAIVSSRATTTPSPQEYPINNETQLRNAMQKLYVEFTKALGPSKDVQHHHNKSITFVQDANRMNFVLSAFERLDLFATHVAKAFLRYAIHKKNMDMQIFDTIRILLRKSYDATRKDNFVCKTAKITFERTIKNNQELSPSILLILLAWSSSSLDDDVEGYGHEILRLSLRQASSSSNVSTVTRILVQWIASSPNKTEAATRSRVALNHVREMPLKDAVFAIGQFACASSGCCHVPADLFDAENIQCRSCDMNQDHNDICSSGVVLALFPFLERALNADNTNDEVCSPHRSPVLYISLCSLRHLHIHPTGSRGSNEIVGKTSRACT